MKEQIAKADFNVLKTICRVAKTLETSGLEILNELGADLVGLSPSSTLSDRRIEKPKLPTSESAEMSKKEKAEGMNYLQQIADYLSLPLLETIIFLAVFSESAKRTDSVRLESIASFFKISLLEMLCLKDVFRYLLDKQLITIDFERSQRRNSECYSIPKDVMNAIINNELLENIRVSTIDRYEFVRQLSKWLEIRNSSDFPTGWLFQKVEDFENRNSELTFLKQLKKLISNIEYRILFYEICYCFLESPNKIADIEDTLANIYSEVRKRFSVGRSIMNKNHILQTRDLIEIKKAYFLSNAGLALTEEGEKLFLEEDLVLFQKQKHSSQSLIQPEKISYKKLFFCDELQQQVDFLQQNLMKEQFTALQQRLSDNQLPKGVCSIFYGTPGTGKTETAFQIAKATGRSVMHVDIGTMKSCWFGESERKMKNLFVSYRQLCEDEEQIPILLFNEADALFAKRKDVGNSGTSQTENAIQNIILEEMETLDGILIATTNLTKNLDAAFERRFLFKVEFTQPTIEARVSIWKSKLDWLTDEESTMLSEQFFLTGGEIDNIVRKVIMHELLHGEKPDIDFLRKLCRDEKLDKSKQKTIGFIKDA